jgi:hypothetical protein
MKIKGWKVSGKHWEWENTKNVYVYGTEEVEQENIEKTIMAISEVIKEFNLPLQSLNGNATKSEDVPIVKNLITNNTQQNLIDFDSLVSELERHRDNGLLPYGLIVLVNPEKYKFKKPPESKEPAIYGCASPEGIIVLRKFDIKNAVRHEFGHMIGLGGEHHQG